ncbi:hypothetical protein Tco_0758735 [Tanacetum coccineum]
MEEYMMKTQKDYGSGIARSKIDDKTHFELKGQFLKELRDNTFSGSYNEDANEHIDKVLEIVDLFHIPEVTQDQIMLLVFPMPLTRAASIWLRNKPSDMQEVILFYKALDVPTRQILDCKGAIPSMKVADAKKGIQDMADHCQKWHNGMSTRAKMNEKVYAAQVGCESCGGPHYTKDCPLKEEGKTSKKAYYTQFGVSSLYDTPKGYTEEFTYGLAENGIPNQSINERLRERMELDLEARLIGEALILNRSLNPTFGDYIELNDLNKPVLVLSGRNQVEDLGPMIEDDEVLTLDAYRDERMDDIIVGKLFCRKICVKTRRLDGVITIYNGNDSVTYHMARSHPRFKQLSNAQCNKMRPLMKVSAQDELNGVSHPYQKLKSFYKGVLNLGTKYVRDAKIEEWLARRQVSIQRHGYLNYLSFIGLIREKRGDTGWTSYLVWRYPDTTPVITPPTTQTDTIVIPTDIPTIVPTVPPSPDYTPASPDYSLASETESNPFEDPSSDHIPSLPAISPFLASTNDTTDGDTPDTPPSPTHGTPFTEIASSTQRLPVIPRR